MLHAYRWRLKFTKTGEEEMEHVHTACALVYKQTIAGKNEHNKKKTKMASARKPEVFLWTDNEVELLLRLTLDLQGK